MSDSNRSYSRVIVECEEVEQDEKLSLNRESSNQLYLEQQPDLIIYGQEIEDPNHLCFKDNIISELESEVENLKEQISEAITIINNKPTIMRADPHHKRTLSSISTENKYNNDAEETEFLKKELEEALEINEKQREDYECRISDFSNQLKDIQSVLDDTLNNLAQCRENLEVRETELYRLKKKSEEIDRLNNIQKEEILKMKKAIKKKEKIENDKFLLEEKHKQSSSQINELSMKLKDKDEELLRLKDQHKLRKEQQFNSTLILKNKLNKSREFDVNLSTPATPIHTTKGIYERKLSTKNVVLEDVLNEEFNNDINDYKPSFTQPDIPNRRSLTSFVPHFSNNFFESPVPNTPQTISIKEFNLNQEFNDMLNQEEEFTCLLMDIEENHKFILCTQDSFCLHPQIKDSACKRLNALEHLQNISTCKSSYSNMLYPLQLESMTTLIDYLKKDLEALKVENNLTRMNYENRIIELEERIILQKKQLRKQNSICTTISTK